MTFVLNGRTLDVATTGGSYAGAGIKLNSPGYSMHDGCTPAASDYCIFSASNASTTKIRIDGPTSGTLSFEICLNAAQRSGCSAASVSLGPALYAGTRRGNIEQSWDDGATWTALARPGGSFGSGVFGVGQTLFAGGFNGYVEVSTDGGKSWSSTAAAPDGSPVLAVFATAANTLYAGTRDGNVALSSDGGASWALAAMPDGTQVNAIYATDNTLFVGTNNALYFSYDGGVFWLQPGAQPAGAPILSIAIANASILYVGTNNQVVSYSADGGNSWTDTPATSGVPAGLALVGSTIYVGTQNGFLQALPSGGSSWDTQWLPDGAPISSVFAASNTLYAGTLSGNVFKSTDALAWTALTQPGGNLNYGLAGDGDGKLYLGGSNGFVYISSDSGASWQPTSGNAGQQGPVQGIYLHNGAIYAATLNQGAAISTDGGQNWSSNQLGISALAIAGSGSTLYEAQGAQVFYSSDNGTNWTATTADPDGSNVAALLATSAGLLAGTDNGDVLISTDNGATWTALTAPDGSAVQALAQSGSRLYAGTANGKVMVSSDGGNSWTILAAAVDGSAVLSLLAQ